MREEIETIRAELIKKNNEFSSREAERLRSELDELAGFILANRDHIGGINIIIIPLEGDALVDPVNLRPCDGISRSMAVHDGMARLLKTFVRDMADRQPRPQMPDLMSMLSGLGGDD